ncbi:MAG: glycosyltransferase family 1 protein [Pseudomonadota bacterium]
MRIALFSGNYNYLREGANQALNILVRYLETNGLASVRVYSPVTETPAFEPSGTLVPVPSIALPVRGEFRLALGLPRPIRDDIVRFDPDLVHVSTPDILGARAVTFARSRSVPVVASMHTRFETYLDYYGLGFARGLVDAHLSRFYRRADFVLAPTAELVSGLRGLRGNAGAGVWSRGVDTERFDPAMRDLEWRRSIGIADEDFCILFLGRLVLEKGISVYTEVVRTLQEKGIRVRPLIVGEGPARAAFAHLHGPIFTGHLIGDALARAVASADVLLIPSTTETFGNVILEAMASGLPVVSASAQNARALISPDRDGYLCSPEDCSAYADALIGLAASPTLRRELGRAAREKSLTYNWDAASASVYGVYRSLADR